MATVYRSSVLDAPITTVWGFLRDFSTLANWFPGVSDCRLEGSARGDHPGCVRNFALPDGSRMREELLEFSDESHFIGYRMLQGVVPMSRYQARVHLLPITDGDRTFMEFTADFDSPAGSENDAAAFLGNTYQTAFEGLKKRFAAKVNGASGIE